jgi:hypothetical protein
MAKPSSYQILNTDSWLKARKFVTLPVILERRHGQVIVRNAANDRAYGMRSASYELIRHEDALQTLQKALLTGFPGSRLVSAQLDNAGARMHLHVDLKSDVEFCHRIVLTNSYDGTLSLGIDTALNYHGKIAILDTAERWIHFGNKASVEKFQEAIKKSQKSFERWLVKILGMEDSELANPRLSVEWFQAEKIIPEEVAERAIDLRPYNGHRLFIALCQAITEYEATPTRKRDMYLDVMKALFSSRRWVAPLDKRRPAPENQENAE